MQIEDKAEADLPIRHRRSLVRAAATIGAAFATIFHVGAGTAQEAAPPQALPPQTSTATPAVAAPIRTIFNLRSRMRDGVALSSDVWLPVGEGRFPVILMRTPYIKSEGQQQMAAFGAYFARHGYAFVVQDVRGRGDSDGEFNFYFQEAYDGYDAIEDLARQSWSNGRVCMMGLSYSATVQWLAAKEQPPHLACIAPSSPSGQYLDELPSLGGAFMLFWALNWTNDTSGKVSQGANAAATDWPRILAHRPLITMDEALGRTMPLYKDFLKHDTLDDYWKRIHLEDEDFNKISIPVMATTGTFDGDQIGTLFYWKGMAGKTSPDRSQYLTFGPWNHIQSLYGGSEKQGLLSLGKDSIVDNKAEHLAFFDRYLKQSVSTYDRPKVRIYVTGRNVWRNFDSFPVAGASEKRLYLTSGGKANGVASDGRLESRPPRGGPADTYVFDPKNPVPLVLDVNLFAGDRTPTQAREDVLNYTSGPLTEPIEAIGHVSVELYASSDARDTDFTAALSDVGPDGKAILLGSRPVGIVRARYRGGPASAPALLTPGKVELYRINLGTIAHNFGVGHRLRVEISSSAFPMFNPNQNTGNPIATDVEWKTARQKIFHDVARPSALVLTTVAPDGP